MSFIAAHFVTFSPLLFLGIAWAVLASLRRVTQQFRTLFLFWFGAPVFVMYLLLSVNKAAAPNWDALAFLSLGVLAVAFWRERIESRPTLRIWAGAAVVVSLLVSATSVFLMLGTNKIKSARIHGWRAATAGVESVRAAVETQLGERVFLIADERDRASEFSFYLRDKTPAQPGHPPVYIVESQDMRNQFSFWPRYDEFVENPAGAPKEEGDVYTEENGVNLFTGRSALYIQSGADKELPRNITAAFTTVEPRSTIEVRRRGEMVRVLKVFLCRGYKTLPL